MPGRPVPSTQGNKVNALAAVLGSVRRVTPSTAYIEPGLLSFG